MDFETQQINCTQLLTGLIHPQNPSFIMQNSKPKPLPQSYDPKQHSPVNSVLHQAKDDESYCLLAAG